MHLLRMIPRIAVCALGVLAFASARADNYAFHNNFAADNSSLELLISTATTQSFSIATTSFATGGFVPSLALFNSAGMIVDSNGSGTSDAVLSDTLTSGTYELFLTEQPNVAVGNLSDGFLFASDPTATGDLCGVSGGMFLNVFSAPCTQLSSAYALNVASSGTSMVTAVAATPEPSSLLLMLAPAAAGFWQMRRRRTASSL